MKFKKSIAILTSFLLTVSLFTSCNNNSTVTEETTTETTTVATTVLSEDYIPKYNLSNENATDRTKFLYDYICETYRNGILSGQQESTWINNNPQHEMEYLEEVSGKLPAIRGLDYMHMDFDGVNKRATEWWDKGGIVSICWHCGKDFTGEWKDSQNTIIEDWDAALTEGTPEYEELIAGMDKGAEALLELKEAGIPVLWRPFHEFDGAWFWWGKGGAENFKKLWQIMYDRYTNHWELDNLIWVLGYSHKTSDGWYPGDEYVDISGADNYGAGTQLKKYQAIDSYIEPDIPLAYHENGEIPDPDSMISDGADWVWFMTWHTDYITDENKNSKETINEVFNHEYVITLDELPDFKI